MAAYIRIPDEGTKSTASDNIDLGRAYVASGVDQDHVCVQRKESRWWAWLQAWYLPPIHILFSLAVWYSMRFQLQDRIFAIGRGANTPPAAPGRWYQSDITTFVAILLMISRIIAGLLQTITTWRCIFFLFEMESVSLPEFEFISSFKLPALGLVKAYPKSSTMWLAVLAIILAWPAQFVSPIATGSLTWIPSYAYELFTQQTSSAVISSAADGDPWTWFQNYVDVRTQLVEQSAGLANIESYLLANSSSNMLVPPARRPTYAFRDLENGTSIRNVTVPYFEILSFEWISDPLASLSVELRNAITDDYSGYLNISLPTDPLLHMNMEGVAAPLKTTSYDVYDTAWPSPYIFHGNKDVALYITRFNNYGDDSAPCSFNTSTNFEATPKAGFVPYVLGNNRTNCYAVAQVNLITGMVQCHDPEQDGSQCSLSSQSPLSIVSHDNFSSSEVMPDSLIDVVFATMPEVMALMITTGGFGSSSMQDMDPEIFLRAAITLAYQGTWSALTDAFAASPKTAIDYIEPTSVVVSAVSKWRMDIWLGIQLLLTVACLLVAILQMRSWRPVVLNPILKLLLLDNSYILAQDRNGLCMAPSLGKQDKSLGRLVFSQDIGTRHHDVLRFHKNK